MRTYFHIILLLITVGLCSGCIKWNDLWGVEDVSNTKQQPLVAVDLGLPSGTLWASKNLLARHPWDCGGKFAWGETAPKDNYSWSTYKFDVANGTVDNRYILDPQDDAASVILGGDWRMPTRWDFEELLEYCNWSTDAVIGGNGTIQVFVVSSKVNSNYIILPLSTRTGGIFIGGVPLNYNYWTNCVSDGNTAKVFWVENKQIENDSRYLARYIRPVSAKRIPLESFSLDQETTPYTPGATYQMHAEFSPSNAFDKHIVWEIDNKDVAELTWEGTLTPTFPGTATVTATSPSTGLVAKKEITISDYVVPNKVDMGLPSGNLWADRNLGAIEEDDMGLFFAWGEIRPKTTFTYENYTGMLDLPENSILPREYDAAAIILGEGWSIPTPDDCRELFDNCDSTIEPYGSSYILTSKINGNKLRLRSWWGYWTSLFCYPNASTYFRAIMASDGGDSYSLGETSCKISEMLIRPVFKEQ